ncbi:hypothetical protein IMZ48_08730 [Candidatus Bathyarchaeota archaeon]|nr:hypothetical protein [Candidatus Bathyarchaeota archaeon]
MVCGTGMSLFIAAIFDWKPTADRDAASLERAVAADDSGDGIPPVDIALTVTLSNRRMPQYGAMSTAGWELHDTILAKGAFRAKTHAVRVERGTFPIIGASDGLCHWYSLRLVFDKSPYPPLEEWVKKRPADIHKYWERTDFYGGPVEGDMYHGTVSTPEERELIKAKIIANRRR